MTQVPKTEQTIHMKDSHKNIESSQTLSIQQNLRTEKKTLGKKGKKIIKNLYLNFEQQQFLKFQYHKKDKNWTDQDKKGFAEILDMKIFEVDSWYRNRIKRDKVKISQNNHFPIIDEILSERQSRVLKNSDFG